MSKGQYGRHKGDIALDNLMRDAKIAKIKERMGIVNKDAVYQCMQKSDIKYPERKTDSELTAVMANGYQASRDKQRKDKRDEKFAAKKLEAELLELSELTGMPIELLRKNPSLRPLDWEDPRDIVEENAEDETTKEDTDDEESIETDSNDSE